MALPKIARREEWVEARRALLAKEKQLTDRRDAVNVERRNLPMVPVDDAYTFDGPNGAASLLDLFEGRSQLIIYHFMFDPEWDDGCPSCTAGTDEINAGLVEHLHTRDTTYALVSRAPLPKLEQWKAKRGWDLPWYSSFGSEFNYDFGVTIDELSRGFDVYNFRTLDEYAAMGQESMKTADQPYEMPGRSCFFQVDGQVFHTYSQYARGLESTGGSYYFLDLTALGRQEEWEEPTAGVIRRDPHSRLRVVTHVAAPVGRMLQMGKLIYSAIASLDGFVEDEQGSFDWAAPDEEVHAFFNDLERPVGTHLYGRRMYETMVYWETEGDDEPVTRDYAGLWRAAEKVVYSRTLQTVTSERTRLEREFDAEAITQLKDRAKSDVSIGGAELAGLAIADGLVDECNLVLVPTLVGGGKRALPSGVHAELELLDERRFRSGVVFLRYRF